jgi:hypothetical protein
MFITASQLLDWMKKYHLMNEELKRILRARKSVVDCDVESAVTGRFHPFVGHEGPCGV